MGRATGSAVSGAAPQSRSGASGWRGEIAGALSATVAMLPFVLSYGFIVFGALGGIAAQVGLTASIIAVVLGAAVMIAFSDARLPSAAPSASTALVLGAAVLTLSRDAAIAASPGGGLPLLLAATAAMVSAAGLLMLLLGACGAGRVVRYVPRPVLAGFMDGVAILIVVSQVPLLFGVPAEAWAREGLSALAEWQWPALAASLGTAAMMALIAARWPRLPAALLAIVIAGVAVALWRTQASPGSAAASLQQFGAVAVALPDLGALATLSEPATLGALAPHARLLVTTTLVLALVAAMESVLNLAAVDQRLGTRSDPDRELVALGAASAVSGALGGLPLVFMRLRAVVAWDAGARDRRSMWLVSALLALVFAVATPLIERLSTAVIAGILVMLAIGLFDRWTRQMLHQWRSGRRSAELGWSLAVVALVCAVTIGWGFAAGVLSGIVVAVWVFVRAMDRQLVRARFSAAEFPSRRVYAGDEERELAPLRQHIRVLELEGALFFGSADRLLDESERLPAATATLIVDLRRVTTVDASGASALVQLAQRLAERRIKLRLSGVRDRHGIALSAHGVGLAGDSGLWTHATLDGAIEAAEHDALATAMPERAAWMPLVQTHLFDGLDARQAQRLASHMTERRLAAGERLFARGDPGEDLYVLTAGSLSIVDVQHGHRYVSFSPGMPFGEIALLDGGGRTADAVADVASSVFALPAAAFAALQREDPALVAQVYRNLATNLSQRLRVAGAAWWHAAA